MIRRWPALITGVVAAFLLVAVPLPASAVDNPPDGSRSGLGWIYAGLVVVAIIVVLLLFGRGRKRGRGRR